MFNTELTDERVASYWDALCDLRIDAIVHASQQAARHWRPSRDERWLPLAVTLREYAEAYRAEKLQQTAAKARRQAEHLLPQRTDTMDADALAALRAIRETLGEAMEMTHPVYREPSLDDPAKRREALLEQARWVLDHSQDGEESR